MSESVIVTEVTNTDTFNADGISDDEVEEEEPLSHHSIFKEVSHVYVKEFSDSPDSSEPGSSEDERRERPRHDINPEYYHIQKMMKYMKTGNQIATITALYCIKDYNLTKNGNILAIQESGGLEVLLNLLEIKNVKCKVAAFHVLLELVKDREVCRCLVNLGGIATLVQNLREPVREVQTYAAEMIHYLARLHKARKHVRKFHGIPRLIELLDINEILLQTPKEKLGNDWEIVLIGKAAARGLWSVSRSHKNIAEMMTCGVILSITKLLRSIHIEIVIPAVAIIANCANDATYQLAIRAEGMIKDIVRQLYAEEYPDSRRYCAETIFKFCEEPLSRNLLRKANGLIPLVEILKDPKVQDNKRLIAAVTGAIWKAAITPENVETFDQLQTVKYLVKLLENCDENENILSNVAGALYECLKFKHNRAVLRLAGGIPYMIQLLNYTFPPLLENLPMTLGRCAHEPESMAIIQKMDGVRLIWSLLSNKHPKVQSNAAKSLVSCIRYAIDSAEMIRCYVGSLEILVKLLNSPHPEVLASICAAIAEVAKDSENLAVMTDYHVVPLLVNLIDRTEPNIRQHLASAIAYCCSWRTNCKIFGKLGAITPLVQYMASNDMDLQRTTALALFHLSRNAFNCVAMHESGAVSFLMKAIASSDADLQNAAAGCLANIRKLALEADTHYLYRHPSYYEESDEELEIENIF